MPIKLFEGVSGAVPFIVDRSSPFIVETRNGTKATKIPGRFSVCDSVNGNNRRYPKKVWEKNLSPGSALKESIGRSAAFGLLEHPTNGQISLLSPICILVTDAKLQPGKDKEGKAVDEVVGEITILGTAEGQKLTALIEAGYNPLVSSRGFGTVIKSTDGVDEVQEDYVCEGWDVVMKPSFESAQLSPTRENLQAAVTAVPGVVISTVTESAPDLKGTVSSSPGSAPAASAKQPITETRMDINSIKSQIASFRAQDVSKLDPKRFAEGMAEMATVHQDIANFVAEDAKRSWQGNKLHDELKGIEQSWSQHALAPVKHNTRLREDYSKVLKVTKAIGAAAVDFKKKLGEALRASTKATKLVEEVTQRGQAWKQLAEDRKQQLDEIDYKLGVACEALDIMATRYKEDMTDIGRRNLTLEFKEKAQAPEIQKLLKEAKTPKDIIAIREQLEGKPADKPAEGDKKDPAAPVASAEKPAPTTESKETSSASKPAEAPASAPTAETVPLSEVRVLVPSVRSVSESIDMVKRLSAATAK